MLEEWKVLETVLFEIWKSLIEGPFFVKKADAGVVLFLRNISEINYDIYEWGWTVKLAPDAKKTLKYLVLDPGDKQERLEISDDIEFVFITS